jgi:hypothetical protein
VHRVDHGFGQLAERRIKRGNGLAFFSQNGIVVVNYSQRHGAVEALDRGFGPTCSQIHTSTFMSAIPFSRILPAALGLVIGGLGLGSAAWMLPVNLKSARQSACG